MGIHNWKAERDVWTYRKTGDKQYGEDNHFTIYLGNKENWINVQGDVYVTSKVVDNGRLPVGLMDESKLKVQEEGKKPRALRLYAWEERHTKAPSQGYTNAMSSGNWRSGAK